MVIRRGSLSLCLGEGGGEGCYSKESLLLGRDILLIFCYYFVTIPDRLTAGRQALNLKIGVRIPVWEPRKNSALHCSRGFAVK